MSSSQTPSNTPPSQEQASSAKKKKWLEHQKFNDIVFVNYNLRLQQKNQMRKQNYDPICLYAFDDHLNWILEDLSSFSTPEKVDAL
ncbi:hypothetical protein AHAS_Ahas11G0249000 [Arachis hypogaea]